MQARAFGLSGLHVPVLGFGAMQVGAASIDDAHAERLLNHVLDAGLTLIDTARSYGQAEERIGRFLAHRRAEFVLSTKVGYGIAGIPDWTYDCVAAGVDAARDRLRTDVIDIVHLHSCGLETLRAGHVTRALAECTAAGRIRVAAYSGDGTALRYAASSISPGCAPEAGRSASEGSGRGADGAWVFTGVQASVNLCDRQSLPLLQAARERGAGTLAKRSLAGRAWAGAPEGDAVHDEYRRRFGLLRSKLALDVEDWDELALRFAAYAPGVDCVIVGGINPAHVDRNLAAVAKGPLEAAQLAALTAAYEESNDGWEGLV